MKNLFVILSIFIASGFSAQKSTEFLKIRNFAIANLSDSLKENSGLEFFQNKLITFNDSGNNSDLFEIDKKSGKILQTYSTGLKNIDWEAIAADSANIYIGDFGNNGGSRKDLKIYRLVLDSALSVREIPFYYPEQNNFSSKNLQTDFDAEAMIYLNGKIHLFTKEWHSKSTTHYVIDPNISENQPAKKLENFPTGYVVTDAAFFDQKLYLIGYTKKTEVFLTIFNESKPGFFFDGEPRKFYLGSALSIGQIEGIAVDDKGIYISGEEFRSPLGKVKQRLYFIQHEKFK